MLELALDRTDLSPRELACHYTDERCSIQFLHATRLDGARDQLAAGDASTSVTSVANRWGFNHLSRFANDYRKRFGQKPSETLKTSQRQQ